MTLTEPRNKQNPWFEKQNHVRPAKNQVSKRFIDTSLGGGGDLPPASDRLHSLFDAAQGVETVDDNWFASWTPRAGSSSVRLMFNNNSSQVPSGGIRYYPDGMAGGTSAPCVGQRSTNTEGMQFESNVNEAIAYTACMFGYRSEVVGEPDWTNGEVLVSTGTTMGGVSSRNVISGSAGLTYFNTVRDGSWWSTDGVAKITDNTGLFPILPYEFGFLDFGTPSGISAYASGFRPVRAFFTHILCYSEVPTQEERLEIKAWLEARAPATPLLPVTDGLIGQWDFTREDRITYRDGTPHVIGLLDETETLSMGHSDGTAGRQFVYTTTPVSGVMREFVTNVANAAFKYTHTFPDFSWSCFQVVHSRSDAVGTSHWFGSPSGGWNGTQEGERGHGIYRDDGTFRMEPADYDQTPNPAIPNPPKGESFVTGYVVGDQVSDPVKAFMWDGTIISDVRAHRINPPTTASITKGRYCDPNHITQYNVWYDRALSDAEALLVIDWLKQKYGVS